jgi:O-methyltransferase
MDITRGESMAVLANDAIMKSPSKKGFELFGLRITRPEPEPQTFDQVRPYLPSGDPSIVDLPKKVLRRLGLKISRISAEVDQLNLVEASDVDLQIINAVRPYTMTSAARVWALVNAIQYISGNRIEGDICECGVWRGGSSMAAALKLKSLGDIRKLWLYDTFAGMSEPTAHDKVTQKAASAYGEWRKHQRGTTLNEWCFAPLDDVRRNMQSTGYPIDLVSCVVGKVEHTLNVPANIPDRIALLRLDTDWYESTKVELEALYDKVSPGGVVIIDDYGHWDGTRRAVEEFFASRPRKMLLDRIDHAGRLGVKID